MAPSSEPANKFPVVCIGLSSGAIHPLRILIRDLGPNTGMAFVVIHHLRDVPTSLPKILAACSPMPVKLAQNGMAVEPNHIYILPSGAQMTLAEGHFCIHPNSKRVGLSNVLTIFLESLAQSRQAGIAVILSGLDRDGSSALKAFSTHGGITIVQDPQTAECPGMPNAALETGCVDFVLPPASIAPKLESLAEQRNSPLREHSGAESLALARLSR